jgi:hypothetical protein
MFIVQATIQPLDQLLLGEDCIISNLKHVS